MPASRRRFSSSSVELPVMPMMTMFSRNCLGAANGAGGFDAAHVGHFFIHQQDVEAFALERGERFATVAHFRDGVAARLQQLAHQFAIRFVIFCNQNAHRLCGAFSGGLCIEGFPGRSG